MSKPAPSRSRSSPSTRCGQGQAAPEPRHGTVRGMTLARDLADRFHQRWLEANPFVASSYGISGYDDLVPDESGEGAQAWRVGGEGVGREAGAIAPGSLTPAEAVTLDCTR